jgi:hypothetical protein
VDRRQDLGRRVGADLGFDAVADVVFGKPMHKFAESMGVGLRRVYLYVTVILPPILAVALGVGALTRARDVRGTDVMCLRGHGSRSVVPGAAFAGPVFYVMVGGLHTGHWFAASIKPS